MPAAWDAKDERQYGHILSSCLRGGRSRKTCSRIAGATVNKTRRRQGRLAGFWGPCARDELMREIRSGLSAPEMMTTRGFKDGPNAWVDIYPSSGPAMRITHSIGANMRVPPTFAGLGMFGAAEPKPKKNVRCIKIDDATIFCWNPSTGAVGYVDHPRAGQIRADKARARMLRDLKMYRPVQPKLEPKSSDPSQSIISFRGLSELNCKRIGDLAYCWDDVSGNIRQGRYVPRQEQMELPFQGFAGFHTSRSRRRRYR